MIGDLLRHYGKLKGMCERLEQDGYTVNVNYEGETIVKVGAGAVPSMFGVAGPVEIKDMDAAMRLAESMRIL